MKNIAIKTPTKAQFVAVNEHFQEQGFGKLPQHCWSKYKLNTCICVNYRRHHTGYSGIGFFQRLPEDYEIISFEVFSALTGVKPEKEVVMTIEEIEEKLGVKNLKIQK